MKRTELLARYYANAVRLGGVLAGSSNEQQQALRQFGCEFGIAGQITNDVADYSIVQYETFAKQYKDTFSDFKGKKMTLPLIFTLDKSTARQKSAIQELLQQDTIRLTDTDKNEVHNIMADCGAFDASIHAARNHAKLAKLALKKEFVNDARRHLSQATVMPRHNKYYSQIMR